jgi:hypothetical protein
MQVMDHLQRANNPELHAHTRCLFCLAAAMYGVLHRNGSRIELGGQHQQSQGEEKGSSEDQRSDEDTVWSPFQGCSDALGGRDVTT